MLIGLALLREGWKNHFSSMRFRLASLSVIRIALIAIGFSCHGESIDYSITPTSKVNFLEATFRLTIPESNSRP
ncbi:MAG TPA: hypothetical protein VGC39_08925, partial [Candidatus Methylacidiphilales bacterium]